MTKSKGPGGPADRLEKATEAARAERLAAALRANLQRRKAQARSREAKRRPEPEES